MAAPPVFHLAADAILVAHALFVGFVVGGQIAILLGLLRGWAWVRGFRFRLAHLAAIGIVVAQAWAGRVCPLTIWEGYLRERAGETAYAGAFVQHWLGRLLFFQAEAWVFTVVYSLFGALVVATWVLAPPRRRRKRDG